MLTQEYLRNLFSYNPETGEFIRNIDTYRRGHRKGEVAGTKLEDNAIQIIIDKKAYKAHRLAFLYMIGEMPKNGVDHIDGNRSNNKWTNLRRATQAQNNQNMRVRKDSTSGLTGVSYSKSRDRWEAKIAVNGKTIHLGRHKTAPEAAEAYRLAKEKYHTFNPVSRFS